MSRHHRRNPDGPDWALVQKHAPSWARGPVTREELGTLLALIDEPDLADSAEELAEMFEAMGYDAAARGLRTPTKVRYALRAIEEQEPLTAAQKAEWYRHARASALASGDVTLAEVEAAEARAASSG